MTFIPGPWYVSFKESICCYEILTQPTRNTPGCERIIHAHPEDFMPRRSKELAEPHAATIKLIQQAPEMYGLLSRVYNEIPHKGDLFNQIKELLEKVSTPLELSEIVR